MIRPAHRDDVPALKAVIDATGLFPSEMLDGMMAGYLNGDANNDFWLTLEGPAGPIGIAYYVPERMTAGTWNLLLIAVDPDHQGRRWGTTLISHVERGLAASGERLLLVETSGLPDFERMRSFYLECGYDEEARIRDFYQKGEDKVVFRKLLPSCVVGPEAR
jgi:ribosomal protein S18 acetylase RimI-like enzyme